MRILLLRHGAAVQRDPALHPLDADRPLTPEGRERMHRAALGLARLADPPEGLYTSPLRRSAETAALLSEAWGGTPVPQPVELLEPGKPIAEVARWLKGVPLESVALVGHEPACSSLIAWLLGCRSFRVHFKKGAAAQLDAQLVAGRLRATLLWHAPPRLLRLAAP